MGGLILGCVWVMVVDSLSYGYWIIVLIECVVDKYESYYFVNFIDLLIKYVDVVLVSEVYEVIVGYQG